MTHELLIGVYRFLEPYLPLLNSHNVDYLTHDHWRTYIPDWVQHEESIDLYALFEERAQASPPPARTRLESLVDEIVEWKQRIEQVTYTRHQFEAQVLGEKDALKPYRCANRTFMSEKKEHEVEIFAPVLHQLATMANADSIIDYGSGRGYLGVRVAHDYDRRVLGLESCEATVHSGERRIELLCKHQKEQLEHQHYRTTSATVTSETNFEELFFQTFHVPSSSFLLCGLHACGALSCSLLYHFVQNDTVRAVANVACCYHLLEEKFSPNPFTHCCSENDPCSFPLSRPLIDARAKLDRNARMLAVQSYERNRADETANGGLWHRALIQVILVEVYQWNTKVEEIKLGKINRPSMTFEQYVWKAVDKLKLDRAKLNSDLIHEYWNRFAHQQGQLHTFVQLKVLFSGLIEMLILLDRLAFLRESACADNYLVSLFDPVKSPRRWCLLAYKSRDRQH